MRSVDRKYLHGLMNSTSQGMACGTNEAGPEPRSAFHSRRLEKGRNAGWSGRGKGKPLSRTDGWRLGIARVTCTYCS